MKSHKRRYSIVGLPLLLAVLAAFQTRPAAADELKAVAGVQSQDKKAVAGLSPE